MVSKIIVWASTREYAIERMKRVLYEYKLVGIKNNIGFLRGIMKDETFKSGKYDTHFIEKNMDKLMEPIKVSKKMTEDVAIIAAYIDYVLNLEENKTVSLGAENQAMNKWKDFGKKKGLLRI
jgi:acetyl-CoA carboxylase biotin carboxylase subunit